MKTDQLKSIYEDMYGPLDAPGKLKNLEELARTLSKLIGRDKPWTARYLNALLCGHKGFTMTGELHTAIEILGAKLDDANPLLARLVQITAYSINGNVEPGSIITGKSTRCPGCLALFVPYSNLQIYCGPECPGRPQRRKAKVGTYIMEGDTMTSQSAPPHAS